MAALNRPPWSFQARPTVTSHQGPGTRRRDKEEEEEEEEEGSAVMWEQAPPTQSIIVKSIKTGVFCLLLLLLFYLFVFLISLSLSLSLSLSVSVSMPHPLSLSLSLSFSLSPSLPLSPSHKHTNRQHMVSASESQLSGNKWLFSGRVPPCVRVIRANPLECIRCTAPLGNVRLPPLSPGSQ